MAGNTASTLPACRAPLGENGSQAAISYINYNAEMKPAYRIGTRPFKVRESLFDAPRNFFKSSPPILLLVGIKTIYGEKSAEGRGQRLQTLERAVLSYFNMTALGGMRTVQREGFPFAREGGPAPCGGLRTPARTWPPPPSSQPVLDAFFTLPAAQLVLSARQARGRCRQWAEGRCQPRLSPFKDPRPETSAGPLTGQGELLTHLKAKGPGKGNNVSGTVDTG